MNIGKSGAGDALSPVVKNFNTVTVNSSNQPNGGYGAIQVNGGTVNLYSGVLRDIVLQVLSFVAENERANIRQRQAEGIAAAKEKGIRFGRVPKPLPENFEKVYRCWANGEITGAAAARACRMPLSTFRYRAAGFEANGK